jgi:hypothetical protein
VDPRGSCHAVDHLALPAGGLDQVDPGDRKADRQGQPGEARSRPYVGDASRTGERRSLETDETVGEMMVEGRLPVPYRGGGIRLALQGIEEALELIRRPSGQAKSAG